MCEPQGFNPHERRELKAWWKLSRSGPRGSGSNSELCHRLQEVKFPALSLHSTQGQGRGTRAKNLQRMGPPGIYLVGRVGHPRMEIGERPVCRHSHPSRVQRDKARCVVGVWLRIAFSYSANKLR
jgi:hypothetical protein